MTPPYGMNEQVNSTKQSCWIAEPALRPTMAKISFRLSQLGVPMHM